MEVLYMKKIIKTFLIVIILLALVPFLVVANASTKIEQHDFEVCFISRDFVSLSNIKIDVYNAYVDDIDDGGTYIYGHSLMYSTYSNYRGKAYLNKPSDKFLIVIDLATLPQEYGIEKNSYFIEEGNEIIVDVLKVDSIKYEGNDLIFYSIDEKKLLLDYTTQVKNDDLHKNDVIFSDKIVLKTEVDYGRKVAINKEIDVSNYTQKEKVDYLYNKGLISNSIRIDKYCDILINKEFEGLHCLNDLFEEIQAYKKDNDNIPFILGNKIDYVLDENGGLRSRPNTNKSYSSTNFKIHYRSTYCDDSTAQAVASYMEGLRTLFIGNYFQTPILEFLSTRYHIYLTGESNGNTLGSCFMTTSNKTTASYIVIYGFDNSLTTDIQTTLSHEYFHAIQNSYNSTSNWFKEAAAEWAGLFGTGDQTQFVDWMECMYLTSASYCNFAESIYNSLGYETAFFALTLDECYCGAETLAGIYDEIGDLSQNYSFSDLTDAIDAYLGDAGFDDTFEDAVVRAYVRLSQPYYLFDSLTGDNKTDAPHSSMNTINTTFTELLEPYSGSLYRIRCSGTGTYRITATIGMSGYPFTASYVRRTTSNGTNNYYAYYKFTSNPLTFTNYLFGTTTCNEICLVPTYFGSSSHSYTLALQVTVNS